MAKALGTIGKVAGIAASIAMVIPGGQAIGAALTVVSTVATLGSQALAKPPPARGSVSQIIVEPDAPQPYLMGEGYYGGVLRHETGYGATLDKVPNPYRFTAVVYSGGGPVQSISPRVDFETVGAWYDGFLYTDTQRGLCPEGNALSPEWIGAPGWSVAHKLSGQASIGWSFKFDKKGKRFASGIPLLGAYGQWVKVYDPRKDDTQPGGVGSHRLGVESTYEWSKSPALHAGTYAYGRYQNGNGPLLDGTPATGKRTLGMGLPPDGIDWAVIAAWANVCEVNGWENFFGEVYEPGDRWANLKDICFAGGAEPVPGGKLTFKYSAPTVALDTVTIDDLTDDTRSITGMQPFRDRINTVVPKYRSPSHKWELVDAAPVVNATFLAEDGEEKRQVWPFNFVTDETHASELAAYRMFDSRELPFAITCKPHMRFYRPGECLHITDDELGVDMKAIILRRQIDPMTMKVTFEMLTETTEKHAYCLGITGVAPPTPAISATGQERDEVADGVGTGGAQLLITRSVNFPLSSDDDSIDVAAFTGVTSGGYEISFPAGTIDTLTGGTTYIVFWHIPSETYVAVEDPATVQMGSADYVIIGEQSTSSGGTYPEPEPYPPGYCVSDDTPILMADGSEKPAGQLQVGDVLHTQHERTMEWGFWPVVAISFSDEEVFACAFGDTIISATGDHLFMIGNRWVRARAIGEPDGTARVAKITVAEAHTYVSAGTLSHNVKANYGGL